MIKNLLFLALLTVLIVFPAFGEDQLYVRGETSQGRDYYLGLELLTEGDFLRIAGYDGGPADELHAKNRTLFRRARVLGVPALVTTMTGYYLWLFGGADAVVMMAGGVLMTLALVPSARAALRGNYILSLHQATLIAEEYNAAHPE